MGAPRRAGAGSPEPSLVGERVNQLGKSPILLCFGAPRSGRDPRRQFRRALQLEFAGSAINWRCEPLIVLPTQRAQRQRHIRKRIVHDMKIKRLAIAPRGRATNQCAYA